MANLSITNGPNSAAAERAKPPKIATTAAADTLTLTRVAASVGLAFIHAPTCRITLVIFCSSSRKGLLLPSNISMPTSSHADCSVLISPAALSLMIFALALASPADFLRVAISSCSLPLPACAVSTCKALKASSPAICLKYPARWALPIFLVLASSSARMVGRSRRLPFASLA